MILPMSVLSGSGKTEETKLALNFLALLGQTEEIKIAKKRVSRISTITGMFKKSANPIPVSQKIQITKKVKIF